MTTLAALGSADLAMRLGEGIGAAAAVPVLRSAVAVARVVALLSKLMPDA